MVPLVIWRCVGEGHGASQSLHDLAVSEIMEENNCRTNCVCGLLLLLNKPPLFRRLTQKPLKMFPGSKDICTEQSVMTYYLLDQHHGDWDNTLKIDKSLGRET